MSGGNVIPFGGATLVSHPADTILERAERGLEYVLVLGIRPDGSRFMSSSSSDVGRALVVIEHFKKDVVTGG